MLKDVFLAFLAEFKGTGTRQVDSGVSPAEFEGAVALL